MKRKVGIKKIILIAICILIILLIFVRNIIGGKGTDREKNNNVDQVAVEGIMRQEAYRLFSYLLYDKEERDNLEFVIADKADSDNPYFRYANALVVSTALDSAKLDNPNALTEQLTCGEFRDLLVNLTSLTEVNYKELVSTLPERLKNVKKGDILSVSEFLLVYEKLIDMINSTEGIEDKKRLPKKATLYFVGIREESSNIENNRMIDQSGDVFYYNHLKNYINYFSEEGNTLESEDFMEIPLEAMVCGEEILYVRSLLQTDITLSNVWIMEGKETELLIYIAGIEKKFETVLPLSDMIQKKIGDITLTDGKVSAITVKPDIINGKVLLTTKKEIEIEGYGTLPIDDNFKIYKIYGTMSMEQTNSILVGYTITDFVVSDGIVCAALIKESIKAENIRVLINTTKYKSLYHSKVVFSSSSPLLVTYGEHQKVYDANTEVSVTPEDEMFSDGRIKIATTIDGAKISLHSVERSYGVPEYRGSIEIGKSEKGLTVVNELSLEEYLYSVVPSEMPTSYGIEALKVQAVCARSFAYNQLLQNKYSAYGAHVDDSVNSQVYNNIRDSEASILAVKDTYGQVLTYNDKVLTAYYFSTSSGHTANIEDVWENGSPVPYLTGKLQTEDKQEVDLSREDNFREFIDQGAVSIPVGNGFQSKPIETYDSGFLMYRWNVTISVEDLSRQINDKLSSYYNANKNSILTLTSKKNEEGLVDGVGVRIINGAVYKSTSVSNIGRVTGMKVITRGESGIIKELLITGTKNTILVRYQTNIRNLLAPINDDLYRLDGSVLSGMNMLPSAFFYIRSATKGGSITEFTLMGGGYGHGVGMSQNGVKTMVNQGKTYEEILNHYYSGMKLDFVYD